MTQKELLCISCKSKIANQVGSVRFMCPNCGKYEIVRCPHCREIAVRYTCQSCNFSGPN